MSFCQFLSPSKAFSNKDNIFRLVRVPLQLERPTEILGAT